MASKQQRLKATWIKHLICGFLCQHCPSLSAPSVPLCPPLPSPLSFDCPASCLLFQLIEQRWRWRWRCCHGWLPVPQMKQKVLSGQRHQSPVNVKCKCNASIIISRNQAVQPPTPFATPLPHNGAHLAEGAAICVRLFDIN